MPHCRHSTHRRLPCRRSTHHRSTHRRSLTRPVTYCRPCPHSPPCRCSRPCRRSPSRYRRPNSHNTRRSPLLPKPQWWSVVAFARRLPSVEDNTDNMVSLQVSFHARPAQFAKKRALGIRHSVAHTAMSQAVAVVRNAVSRDRQRGLFWAAHHAATPPHRIRLRARDGLSISPASAPDFLPAGWRGSANRR